MLSRRSLIGLAAGAAAWPRIAAAGDYPNRPIRLIVGSAAASAPDIVARLVADGLADELGQPVVVENHPGASTIIGTSLMVKAAGDGYSLGYVTPSFVLNRALHVTLPFDADRDLQPIVQVGSQPLLLAVSAASPYRTLAQLTDAATSRPGRLTYASTGPASIFHLAAELFALSVQAKFVHVPYTSGPQAINDLMSGRIDFMFNAVNALLPQVRNGRLRGLAVTSPARSAVLPGMPTLVEQKVDCEIVSWGGLVMPARTPADIVAELNVAANAALRSPGIRRRLEESGYDVVGGSPEQFQALLASELVRWSDVVRRSGLQSG